MATLWTEAVRSNWKRGLKMSGKNEGSKRKKEQSLLHNRTSYTAVQWWNMYLLF